MNNCEHNYPLQVCPICTAIGPSMAIKDGMGVSVTNHPVSPSPKAAPTSGDMTVPGVTSVYCIRRDGFGEVLLTDGFFTSPNNCMAREYGYVLYTPLLFHRLYDARKHLERFGRKHNLHISEYTWALIPWERAGSIVKTAVDAGYASRNPS